MIRQEIIEYVESCILPLYNSFDKGHGIDHATTVMEESAKLATHYDVNAEMVYIIAAYHDTGLREGREHHHIVSGEIVMADEFIAQHFTAVERETMREAVEDHRASIKHEPRSIYGKIVAEADRVISTDVTLRRTVQYGLKLDPTADRAWHYARFTEHLQNKYAEGGYIKLWIPYSDNAARLAEFREVLSDSAELERRFNEIFESETVK